MVDKMNQPFIVKKAYAWLTVALLMVTLFGSVSGGFSYFFNISDDLSDHISTPDIHMTYKDQVREFIPRSEFIVLKEDIKEMKDDIKTIRNILLNK